MLSYKKDRRNMIAESRSLSRISIAKKRANSHQSFRHAQRQIIIELVKRAESDFDALEKKERVFKVKGWRKWADSSLGEFVSVLLKTRHRRGINKSLKNSKILRQVERKSPVVWSRSRWGITRNYFKNVIEPSIK